MQVVGHDGNAGTPSGTTGRASAQWFTSAADAPTDAANKPCQRTGCTDRSAALSLCLSLQRVAPSALSLHT
ncbi:hypothetical protein GJ688_00425 [Heliobacillus mobilis]|uniref:Uncharacterized protein n=1 Tax=Heliobacterium mobile TaxID=28064 RepID=A0A6I3SGA2_HELMO|nr:hypothetical protein [Heliobacterium mobile]